MAHIEAPQKNISWSGCVGYSDDKQAILSPDQPAMIASSMKPYVAATILKLEEDKKLTIEDPIKDYLLVRTKNLFEKEGYDLEAIRIKHLLSHTSGIYDYLQPEYFSMIANDKQHRWTREEQLMLSILMGSPLAPPADTFVYTDANYLLAAEIIESIVEKPYYSAMKDLLKFNQFDFKHTWFPTLESPNPTTKNLVHQYCYGWDSYDVDPSFDLYGGGGMATTTEELARFSNKLFSGEIITDSLILSKIFSRLDPQDGNAKSNYCLGLTETNVNGYKCYIHGGFWGTSIAYFPELKTSIAVFILKQGNGKLKYAILESLIKQIENNR